MNTSTNVKIERIIVKNLFGKYDYDLALDDSVSIIIAPNGLGKTTIFRFIKAIMTADRSELFYLRKVPFDVFYIKLSDDSILSLKRTSIEETFQPILEKIQSSRIGVVLKKAVDMGLNYRLDIYTSYDSEKEQSGENTKTYTVDYLEGLFASIKRPIQLRETAQLIEGFDYSVSEHIRILKDTGCFYPVNFIPSDRLFTKRKPEMRTTTRHNETAMESNNDKLKEATDDMLQKVNFMVRAYSMAIAEAQTELPMKYLQPEENNYPNYPDFKEKWDAYLLELRKYNNLGFIEDDASRITEITEKNYKDRKAFLNIYLKLFSETTIHLKKDYDKFELFKKIFDERNELTEKEIKFTPDGIKTIIGGKRVLDSNDMDYLSSGEKNDFIMFYELLFDTKQNGIVMIDEPEISLHISWQDTFVEHLVSIAEENGLQVLIATHSPHIVSGHFDLIKEL